MITCRSGWYALVVQPFKLMKVSFLTVDSIFPLQTRSSVCGEWSVQVQKKSNSAEFRMWGSFCEECSVQVHKYGQMLSSGQSVIPVIGKNMYMNNTFIWEVQAVNNAWSSYTGIGRCNLSANKHFFLLCQEDERCMKKLRSSQQQVHNPKPIRIAPPPQWVTPQTHLQHCQPTPDQKWMTP